MTPKSTLDGQVTTNWDERFAERTQSMMSSIIRDLLKLALQPDIISFAGGMPASELFLIGERTCVRTPASFPIHQQREHQHEQ